MSDELKPKIDLKARLGKRAVQTQEGAASVPPPIGMGRPGGVVPQPGVGVPPVRVAPVGSSPSQVPPPPMGSVPRSSAPYASAPYASAPQQPAPVMRAEPREIRVEMGEEVIEERKRAAGKVRIGLAIVAVAAGGLGFFIGGRAENSSLSNNALKDAQGLLEKVKKANATVDELNGVLTSAIGKFKEQKFPSDEVSKLGGINIPFSNEDLPQSIGRLGKPTRAALLSYLMKVQEANERKESLGNVLSSAQKPFEELLADRVKPKVRFAAVVASGAEGPWLQLAQVSEPFLVQEAGKSKLWPTQLNVKRVADGKLADAKLDRVEKTDFKNDMALPIDPASQGFVCPSADLVGKMRSELVKLQESLNGDETPGAEKEGLKQLGDRLSKALAQLGTGGGG
ncbi:MAG: hypothetical protein SFV15_26010 [Polyangiaceae bacterium]|nr:hypothetical protein [Polyangiaceae bacterium]